MSMTLSTTRSVADYSNVAKPYNIPEPMVWSGWLRGSQKCKLLEHMSIKKSKGALISSQTFMLVLWLDVVPLQKFTVDQLLLMSCWTVFSNVLHDMFPVQLQKKLEKYKKWISSYINLNQNERCVDHNFWKLSYAYKQYTHTFSVEPIFMINFTCTLLLMMIYW